jgi:N utilization substance protein A
LVSQLFELEVPEISSGQLEIKSIARDPGSRSKIAVFSKEQDLDPVGSTIGQKGSRVGAVINELGGEKVDIIEYSEKPELYIKNALLPAKALEVKILSKNRALALVLPEQLSLAIGRNGQNVRLAAELTGWKIDIQPIEKSPSKEDISKPEKEEVKENN